jgi:Uma2 family endonuclease
MPRDVSAVIQVPLMLAVEVVSPGAEQIERDYTDKVAEYADCGIPEYWIVDPIEQKVTVNLLEKGRYIETVYTVDEEIESNTFPELKLTVNKVLSAM